jgi:hypothetical protein
MNFANFSDPAAIRTISGAEKTGVSADEFRLLRSELHIALKKIDELEARVATLEAEKVAAAASASAEVIHDPPQEPLPESEEPPQEELTIDDPVEESEQMADAGTP